MILDDGVEALNYFTEHKYDIILMDENMPNMNGIEATHQIRLIIGVTANALVEDPQKFMEAGNVQIKGLNCFTTF